MAVLWLTALGKPCCVYESGVYDSGRHWMRGLFHVLWKLEKRYSEAANCKNCKEGPMVKAEAGICPQLLRVSPVTRDKFAKWSFCRWWLSACSRNSEAWLVMRLQFWLAEVLNLKAAPEDELETEKAQYHSKHSETVNVRLHKPVTPN